MDVGPSGCHEGEALATPVLLLGRRQQQRRRGSRYVPILSRVCLKLLCVPGFFALNSRVGILLIFGKAICR